mgnify:CR=1 FL=1
MKAITDVELVRIDDHMLDIMLTWDQLTTQAGDHPVTDRSERTDWRMMSGAFRLEALTAGALSQLPPANIDELLRRFERVKFKAGATVLREGDDVTLVTWGAMVHDTLRAADLLMQASVNHAAKALGSLAAPPTVPWRADAEAAANAAAAAAPARPGAVVFGPDTRIVLEFQNDDPTFFYIFSIVNNARTPVAPPQLDEFLMASEAHLRRADLEALGWTEADIFGPPGTDS